MTTSPRWLPQLEKINWERFLMCQRVAKREEFRQQSSTTSDYRQRLINYFIKYSPRTDWSDLISDLYSKRWWWIGDRLNIPRSKLDAIEDQHSRPDQCSRACWDLYVSEHRGREWPLHFIYRTALKSWRWYRRSTSRASSFKI